MKKIFAAILVLTMAFSMCSCKKSVSMTIRVDFSGQGFSGEELDQGSYEIEIKGLKEGDRIYELEPGKLSKDYSFLNQKECWILEIDSIDNEYVKYSAKSGNYLPTGTPEKPIVSYENSYYGFNYFYTVISVDGGREPFMQNW